jgi:predicted enzyme related to lactoylglutathione lyase
MSDAPLGRFCWYDLMTSNPDGAKAFYTKIVGWGTDIWEGGEQPYLMFTNADTPLGGVMSLPPELVEQKVPPHWLTYIYTPDVSESCAKAEKLGGKVMYPATDIPTVGTFAVLADPQGAVFAVFSSASEAPGSDAPPAKGQVSWHDLATTDHEAAWAFYSELFGWKKMEAMDMGGGNMYQMFGRSEFPLGGMYNKPPEMPAPPNWLPYIMVDDVNASVEEIQQLGGQILNGPMEVPGGDLVAQCLDPQGAAFAIHSTAAGS